MDRVHQLHAKAKSLIQKQIDHHESEINKLRSMVGMSPMGTSTMGNPRRGPKGKKSAAIKRRGKGKRIRRDPAVIQREALEVADAIKQSGKDGLSASGFPPKIKIIGSPKVWLKKFAPGFKFKVKGEKSKTRYYAA
jgi:hypothetical protein